MSRNNVPAVVEAAGVACLGVGAVVLGAAGVAALAFAVTSLGALIWCIPAGILLFIAASLSPTVSWTFWNWILASYGCAILSGLLSPSVTIKTRN
jgi:hypothetical protein